ncbi:GL16437 [Drosophila persimilis]|uniref:acylphosphatase n=1 Tax=Drosophila persimilis TaxID=7234 RepID=B4GWI1_DROPE|nr:GL16437 [Drosophila persimilis]
MSEAKAEAKAETKGMVMMSCDFQIKGQIPKEAFELFAAAQAQILGLRGYIMQVSENCFQGQLQGPQLVIETFKQVILSVAEYVAAVKEFVITNLTAIQECSYKTFEVKSTDDCDPQCATTAEPKAQDEPH